MNIFLNEYFGFCFELNFELNHFWAKFNEKMNFHNVSNRAIQGSAQSDLPPLSTLHKVTHSSHHAYHVYQAQHVNVAHYSHQVHHVYQAHHVGNDQSRS